MATPESFGDRIHFEGDGCDKDSIRHSMYFKAKDLQWKVFKNRIPVMGKCISCGMPVMEEEFDCGNHNFN